MTYALIIARRAQKQIESLDPSFQRRVDAKILSLAGNPRPPGVEKLVGAENVYRVRVGDWRIVYQIRDRELIVLVVRVGHRREVYR